MNELAQVLGLILGIVSILGVVGGAFYWKGKTDSIIKACDLLPERTKALEIKMNVVWTLFVDQTLSDKPNLAKRGSGYKITEEGEKCLNSLSEAINQVKAENQKLTPSDVLFLINQKIGFLEIQKAAKESHCTVAEFYALITVKLGIEV